MHKVEFDTTVIDGSGKLQYPGTYHPGEIFLLFLVCQRPFIQHLSVYAISYPAGVDAKWRI